MAPTVRSNGCDEVELFQDGISLGICKIEQFGHGEWKVIYRQGKLEAIGRIDGNKYVRIVGTETGVLRVYAKAEGLNCARIEIALE